MRPVAAPLLLLLLAPAAQADRFTPGRHEDAKDPKPRPRAAWTQDEPVAPSEPEPLAIVGADIHPVTRAPIVSGTLLLKGGRIEAVLGSAARIPAGYRVVDGRGLQAWPGYVAAGSDGLGLTDDAWAGGQDAMLARGVAESFDPWADGVELAASAGITTMLTWRAPGGAKGPLAGRAAILKMSVREPRGAVVSDLAAAVAGPGLLGPEGRQAARKAVEAAREQGPRKNDPLAALWRALARREAPLLAMFDAAGDILSVAELAKDLRLRLVLVTPAEAWPLADRLAEDGVAVIQNVRHSWGKPREDRRGGLPGGWRFDAVARLRRAGVETAVVTDSPTISPWGVAGRDLLDLPLEAAFAVRAGLSEQEAIESITIAPARILGIDDRVGSLEAGKDADFIVLSGDPLSLFTRVEQTWVEGVKVFDLAVPDDRKYAEGGWGVGHPRVENVCCLGGGEDR